MTTGDVWGSFIHSPGRAISPTNCPRLRGAVPTGKDTHVDICLRRQPSCWGQHHGTSHQPSAGATTATPQRGFDLRKWRSSSQLVLDTIDPSLHEKIPTKTLTEDATTQFPKALGKNNM